MIQKDAKCIAVYGRRGCGKSTRVKDLIRSAPRVVVFDPMGEYEAAGCRPAATVADVLRGMTAKRFRLAYVPRRDHVGSLHRLASYLWEAQAPYAAGTDHRKLTLVVEEMNLAFPAHNLPRDRDAFLRLVLQGRHRGVEIIGVTQRPALVSPNFRSNAAEVYCFALSDEADISVMARALGRQREAELRSLPVHHYLRHDGEKVSAGRNRLR